MNSSKQFCATLYLASTSNARRQLLDQARIPFTIIKQDADEHSIDWSMPPADLVSTLALLKMNHAQIPPVSQDNPSSTVYVLTADTITCDTSGTIYGKPHDREEARTMIQALAQGSRVYTGFCVDKRVFGEGAWHIEKRITQVVEGSCTCIVPAEWVERYLDETGVLDSSGALVVDDFGSLFVKEITGSYTGIIGLPLYEVRQALEKLGFFGSTL